MLARVRGTFSARYLIIIREDSRQKSNVIDAIIGMNINNRWIIHVYIYSVLYLAKKRVLSHEVFLTEEILIIIIELLNTNNKAKFITKGY